MKGGGDLEVLDRQNGLVAREPRQDMLHDILQVSLRNRLALLHELPYHRPNLSGIVRGELDPQLLPHAGRDLGKGRGLLEQILVAVLGAGRTDLIEAQFEKFLDLLRSEEHTSELQSPTNL